MWSPLAHASLDWVSFDRPIRIRIRREMGDYKKAALGRNVNPLSPPLRNPLLVLGPQRRRPKRAIGFLGRLSAGPKVILSIGFW